MHAIMCLKINRLILHAFCQFYCNLIPYIAVRFYSYTFSDTYFYKSCPMSSLPTGDLFSWEIKVTKINYR